MTQVRDDSDDGPDGAVAPPRALIVTVYGFYGRGAGGWLPIGALVRLLGDLGVEAPAVRSSISRLKRRDVLEAQRRDGRAGYALSSYGAALLAAGDRRIYGRAEDGEPGWVLAVFSVPESQRQQRHRLRSRLASLGFGTVANGVWIAPAAALSDARAGLERDGLEGYVDLFTAAYAAFGDPAAQVARWWDLDRIDAQYRRFTEHAEPVLQRWSRRAPGGPDAFADYVRVLTAWRRLPFLDPGLPRDVLPAQWAGRAAADLFAAVRSRLEEPSRAHAAAAVAAGG